MSYTSRHIVYEPDTPHRVVESAYVSIGDTIVYMTDNQLGYAVYRVVCGPDGSKILMQTEDINGDIA